MHSVRTGNQEEWFLVFMPGHSPPHRAHEDAVRPPPVSYLPVSDLQPPIYAQALADPKQAKQYKGEPREASEMQRHRAAVMACVEVWGLSVKCGPVMSFGEVGAIGCTTLTLASVTHLHLKPAPLRPPLSGAGCPPDAAHLGAPGHPQRRGGGEGHH